MHGLSTYGAIAPRFSADTIEPNLHTVQFYSDDSFLLDATSLFIGEALLAGHAGIVIATEAHREGLAQRLRNRGLDLAGALRQGQYAALDAAETLTRFMVGGWPDGARFAEFMEDMIRTRAATVGGTAGTVAVFGEMVSLLCSERKFDAATCLEQLWNDFARIHSLSLRCAYRIHDFDSQQHHRAFLRICGEHAAIIPAESYSAITTDQERLRTIAELQQKALALETEIVERRKAEQLLQHRETELRDFLESAVVAMHWVDANGTILWANNAELQLLGYSRDEYLGHHISEFHADAAVIQDILQRLNRREELHGYEARLKCKDGSIRHVRIHSNTFFQDGRFIHTRCFTVDITEEKAANEALFRLAAIVESSDDAIISKNLDGIVTSWNSSAENMFGYTAEEIVGRPITTIIPPELQDDERRILATLRRGERIEHFETVRITKPGERLNVSLTISPVKDKTGRVIGAAKIVREVSQRKRMEEALRTTEKLAAVGRLAATIAHEINNPLEAVMNLVYLAKNHVTASKAIQEYLLEAEEELGRVADLTKQTLGFYREQKAATRMRLSLHLQELLSISSSKITNKGINIRLETRQDPEILAIPGEIRQLLANILNNSIDAVNYGGVIRIRISAARQWNVPAPGVRVTIADSGPGISRKNRNKIFEPFFTTKTAVGTGLGLWICKTIVDRHLGTIKIRSNTTSGRSWTAVSVHLPVDSSGPPAAESLPQAMLNPSVKESAPMRLPSTAFREVTASQMREKARIGT